LSLDLEGLKEAALVLLNQGPHLIVLKKIVGDLRLQYNVLVEEFELPSEIFSDNITNHPNVCQVAPFIQNDLHFSGG